MLIALSDFRVFRPSARFLGPPGITTFDALPLACPCVRVCARRCGCESLLSARIGCNAVRGYGYPRDEAYSLENCVPVIGSEDCIIDAEASLTLLAGKIVGFFFYC